MTKNNRIFAIGDIHGEYAKLEKLINLLYIKHELDLSTDKIILMGDLIDRGPDSYSVLKYAKLHNEKYPRNFLVLKGNHEEMLVKWHNDQDKWDLWSLNGGIEARNSFKEHTGFKSCPDYLLEWVTSLPLFHKEPGFFFSHAPIPQDDYRNNPLLGDYFTKDELIWAFNREVPEDYFAREHNDGIIGVCGHIHALSRGVYDVRVYPHYIFTDAGCGCAKGAPLCAVEVHSRQVVYSV